MSETKNKREILKKVLGKAKDVATMLVPSKAAANFGGSLGSMYGALMNKKPKSVIKGYVWQKMSGGKPLASSPANVDFAEKQVKGLSKKIQKRMAEKAAEKAMKK